MKIGGTGRLTYCHTAEEGYSHELFVCCQVFEDITVRREVDEDCEGVFCYFLLEISLGFSRELELTYRIVSHKKLQVFNGKQLICLEYGGLGEGIGYEILDSWWDVS